MAEARGEETTLGQSTYFVSYLPPQQASDLAIDLFKVLGPAFAMMMSGAAQGMKGEAVLKASLLDQDLEPIVVSLAKTLDKAALNQAMQALAKVTYVTTNGTKANLTNVWNTHFTGRIGEMYRWFFFALKTNFADVFTFGNDNT